MAPLIELNFIELTQQEFMFPIHRKLTQDGESRSSFPGCKSATLPVERTSNTEAQDERGRYWYAFSPFEGSEQFECSSFDNRFVTTDFLFSLLKDVCSKNLNEGTDYKLGSDEFEDRIFFFLASHSAGRETVWLQPYFLKSEKRFGFLLDFRFLEGSNSTDRRTILKLSLALDKNGFSNKNYYADRYDKISTFVTRYFEKIFPLKYGQHEITAVENLFKIKSAMLNTKKYVFSDGQVGNSQYTGIRDYGPFRIINAEEKKVCILYPKGQKALATDLYQALIGKSFATFPGMLPFFKYDLHHNIIGAEVSGYSEEALKQTLEEARTKTDRDFVALMVAPFGEHDEEMGQDYIACKHFFLQNDIPSQFVTSKLLLSKSQLKWSIANIALQLFSKLGGVPWVVSQTGEKSLIIGIGQAHQRNNDGTIQKFFSYSILTDSSGLYKDLQVLGDSQTEADYNKLFRDKLSSLIREYINDYDKFVIHTPFKLRRGEMEHLQEVLHELSQETSKKFIAIKFNDKNKYFGFSESSNTKVPYESSYIRLSESEYLVWFEGLQFNKPTVTKRYGRPMHVEFLYPLGEAGLVDEQKKECLQDAINLSGANWRGFNAKSAPVSVYYAKLVAKFYKEFSKVTPSENDCIMLQASKSPWFL